MTKKIVSKSKVKKRYPRLGEGEICVQWKRCGKANCKCKNGGLHGPYHCLFWRDDGQLQKVYIKSSEVDSWRLACESRRKKRVKWRKTFDAALKELQFMDRYLNGMLE